MSRLAVLILTIVFLLAVKPVLAIDTNYLIANINQFRQTKGLSPVRTDPLTCQFAAIRAKEVSTQFTHDGFYSRVKNYSLPYPKYKLVTENLAWAPEGQNPVNMWINSPSHAANMLKSTTFVCVEKYGDYYAFEGLQV